MVSIAPSNQVTVAFVPPTLSSTQPIEVEVVAQVSTYVSPPVVDLHELYQQAFAKNEAKVVSIHPYMPMSNRLVTVNDSILADPEHFDVGITMALPEDQKVFLEEAPD